MGLNCSHGAFDGAYSAFNRFRQAVCFLIGGSYPPHYLYTDNGELIINENKTIRYDESLDENLFYWGEGMTPEKNPGLWEFLTHSDCDGDISPEMCKTVADELQVLVPAMKSLTWQANGHIQYHGGFAAVLEKFIAGCRLAHKNNESLNFH